VVYLRISLSPEEASRIYLCYWKETIQESDNVVIFPITML